MHFKRIYFEITNRCNLHCRFCKQHTRFPEDISPARFAGVLPDLRKHTDHLYLHVKGEPLLHPQLDEILSLCAAHEFSVNLTTNGTLLSSEKDLLLQASALRQVNISVHSFTEQTTLQQETYLQDLIDFAKQASSKMFVNFRFWNRVNHSYDATSLRLLRCLAESFRYSFDPERAIVQRNATLAPNVFLSFDRQFQWPSLNAPMQSIHGSCYGLRQQCAILVDGTVVPCCLDGDGVIALGNIFQAPLEQILSEDRAQKITEGFRTNRLYEPLCQRCGYLHK